MPMAASAASSCWSSHANRHGRAPRPLIGPSPPAESRLGPRSPWRDSHLRLREFRHRLLGRTGRLEVERATLAQPADELQEILEAHDLLLARPATAHGDGALIALAVPRDQHE